MSKSKKCKYCSITFTTSNSFQTVCSISCSAKLARKNSVKKAKAEKKIALERIKTRSEYMKEAQVAFNAYIRARDAKEPCISCGRQHEGQYHAGHYRSVGSCPELRFNELNVHKQCSVCNNYLSGNLINYRINLIKKIGLNKVEWLEGKHEQLKLTVEQIKELKIKYRKMAREVVNG